MKIFRLAQSSGSAVVLAQLIATVAACAQSLMSPAEVAGAKKVFESAGSARPLRCAFTHRQPALNYGLRFEAGYEIDVPLTQFRGPGHEFNVLLNVTPEGREPVYLATTQNLPDVPSTKADAALSGSFLVGEGVYAVEALVQDDSQRVCASKWRIQAKWSGTEQGLERAMPAHTVAEAGGDVRTEATPGARIGRLAILLHAAPVVPRRAKLQPEDVDTLTASLASLLEQLPARSVRLVAFNLDRQAVLVRSEDFKAQDVDGLRGAMAQLDLGVVDYRSMQERKPDLLNGLLEAEVQNLRPADAVIVMGPGAAVHADIPATELSGALPGPLFYLQFRRAGILRGNGGMANRPRIQGNVDMQDQAEMARLEPWATPDPIEHLVGRLKGDVIPIQSPQQLAGGIRRIAARVPRTAPAPAPTTATAASRLPTARTVRPKEPSPADVPSGGEDPTEVLIRLRDQVLAHGERVPNHTCVETVMRERYETADRSTQSCDAIIARAREEGAASRLRLATTDRLRLDVALAGDREIYSWAGAAKFEEGDIDELIPEGAMGTGPFAAMLLSVFETRNPRFLFEGQTMLDVRRVYEYSFTVSKEQSHYRIKAHKEWLITGYTGSLLVDPETAELVRLRVRTDELPPATSLCETQSTLDFGMVRLAANDYLLPRITHQRFIGRDGGESENTVTFSACREYLGESVVSFGESGRPAAGTEARPRIKGPDLPAGLPVTIGLTTAINDESAAGDRITGRLIKPVVDPARHVVLLPEGAAVEGRLMRVEVHHPKPTEFTIALRWETIEVNGRKLPLSVRPNRLRMSPPEATRGLLRPRGMTIELPLPGEERYQVYHFPGSHPVVYSGLQTEWLTERQ
jgi:hypothetical protein